MGHFGVDFGGFCSPLFPSGIAEPAPAVVIVGFVYIFGFSIFPLFEADNLEHIPKLTGDFGIILVKGQKVGEMAHNFQSGSLGLDLSEHIYHLLCL